MDQPTAAPAPVRKAALAFIFVTVALDMLPALLFVASVTLAWRVTRRGRSS